MLTAATDGMSASTTVKDKLPQLSVSEGVPVAPSKNTEREAREARDRLRRYNARQEVHSTQVKRRKRDNLFGIGAVVVIAALATVTQIFYFNGGPGTPSPS